MGTNTSGLVQKPSNGGAQWALEAKGCRQSLDRKSDLLATLILNAFKQKHNTNDKGTGALELHKCQDNFGATHLYVESLINTRTLKKRCALAAHNEVKQTQEL